MQIGGRKIIHAGVYHVLDGESMEFDCRLPDDDVLHIRFLFTDEPSASLETSEIISRVSLGYELAEDGRKINVAILDFKNFNGPLGQGLRSPLILAVAEGGQLITFLGTVYKFETLRKIEFQVMYGGVE